MKKLFACILVLAAISLCVSGCKEKTEAPAKDVPGTNAPAEAQPPKDHPAH